MLWRFDPWREVERLRREMDALTGTRASSPSFPLMNVYDNKDEMLVVAELPGMKTEDVSVILHDGSLNIKGSRSPYKSEGKAVVLRQERAEGEFEKSLRIPFKVKEGGIAANFRDGVLTITVPKAEEAKPKSIVING